MPGVEIEWMNQSTVLAEPPGPSLVGAQSGQAPAIAEPYDRPRLATSLLAFQAAMYFVTALEAAAMGAISGNAAGWGPSVLSLLLAIALLRCAHRVRNNRPWRRVQVLEFSLLGWVAIDLALAVFLSGTWLGLLPTLTRIVVPVTVIVLLSRKRVR
jgi:hypothetical protein